MAVPAYLRNENNVEYISTASRLAAWSLKWCKDERLFSRRERWLVTGDLWTASKNVLKSVKKANRKYNNRSEEEFQEREALLRSALDALTDIEVLLQIKYDMVSEGFNAIKQPETAQPSEPQTEQRAENPTEQGSPKKKNRRKRAVLTQDDVDRIFEIFLEYVCKEEELIKGVIRSDEKVRSGTSD